MTLKWTRATLSDLQRLHAFLHPVNPDAAARVIQRLTEGPDLLQTQPREVRSILIGDYELRYEITADQAVWILRVWRTREFR